MVKESSRSTDDSIVIIIITITVLVTSTTTIQYWDMYSWGGRGI